MAEPTIADSPNHVFDQRAAAIGGGSSDEELEIPDFIASKGGGAKRKMNPVNQTWRHLSIENETLTQPKDGDLEDIAIEFLRDNAGQLGLEPSDFDDVRVKGVS